MQIRLVKFLSYNVILIFKFGFICRIYSIQQSHIIRIYTLIFKEWQMRMLKWQETNLFQKQPNIVRVHALSLREWQIRRFWRLRIKLLEPEHTWGLLHQAATHTWWRSWSWELKRWNVLLEKLLRIQICQGGKFSFVTLQLEFSLTVIYYLYLLNTTYNFQEKANALVLVERYTIFHFFPQLISSTDSLNISIFLVKQIKYTRFQQRKLQVEESY